MSRSIINKFIQCSCNEGGLKINGININNEVGYVQVINLHSPLYFQKLSLWERIKVGFQFIFGKDVYGEDVLLDQKGVQDLQKACQDCLDRWPEDLHKFEQQEDLNTIYQSIKDEELGRKIRLSKKD